MTVSDVFLQWLNWNNGMGWNSPRKCNASLQRGCESGLQAQVPLWIFELTSVRRFDFSLSRFPLARTGRTSSAQLFQV